jgi:hypothetical protein
LLVVLGLASTWVKRVKDRRKATLKSTAAVTEPEIVFLRRS